MTVDILIHGAGGRMGLEIARTALGQPEARLVGGVDQPGHAKIGADLGVLCGGDAIDAPIVDSLETALAKPSVVIDFTAPQATQALCRALPSGAAGLVVGTTGLGDAEKQLVAGVAAHIPVVYSPNMSLAMNLLFHLTRLVAGSLGEDFDIEIVEAHHRHKKDAPSGTAVRLGEMAAEGRGGSYEQLVVHGREGMVGERPPGPIGMHAVRGGDIVGDHAVLFAGNGERLELKHVAHNRTIFASGAVKAALWLADRKPGLYSMADVLGL